MVDGYSLLEHPHLFQDIIPFLRNTNKVTFNLLFSVMSALNVRYDKAKEEVMIFVFEEQSRILWFNTGKRWPCDDSWTGVQGGARLGVNDVQSIWYSWNQQEDMRTRDDFTWSIAKQGMACHAPKGVKKINEKDRTESQKRENERKQVLDKFYYKKIGVLTEEEEKNTNVVDGVLISSANSVEEMQEEMRKWVAGEQDDHDKIVAAYKEGILNRLQNEDALREERLRMVEEERRKQEEDLGMEGKPLVGYTLEQIRDIQKERGHNPDKNVGYIGYASRKNYAKDKWLTASISKGSIVEFNGRLITRTEYEKLNPSPKEDLQTQVERRAQGRDK